MPTTKKTRAKKNYRALAHSQELSTLAVDIHKDLERGEPVTLDDVEEVIKHANNLKASLVGTFVTPASAPLDPFLVDKVPTVQVPVPQIEKSKEEVKKSGFLSRG